MVALCGGSATALAPEALVSEEVMVMG